MKPILYGLFLATTVFLFASCEKENLQNATGMRAVKAKKPHSAIASEKTIPIISVTANSSCGAVVCQFGTGPVMRYNALRITNLNQAMLPSLTYTLYEMIATVPSMGIEIYQPFAQFSCSQHISTYATAAVNNGAKILVYANDPAYAAPNSTAPAGNVMLTGGVLGGQLPHTTYQTVIAGNFEGTLCGRDDLKDE